MQSFGEDVGDLIDGVNVLDLKHTGGNLLPDEVNVNFDMLSALMQNRVASKGDC